MEYGQNRSRVSQQSRRDNSLYDESHVYTNRLNCLLLDKENE